MRVMLDADIILDVLLERRPFVDDSFTVLRLCEDGTLEGFICAPCAQQIYRRVQDDTGSGVMAQGAVGKLLRIVHMASFTDEDLRCALTRVAGTLEDRIAGACADSIGCEKIVTRHPEAFAGCAAAAVPADELLAELGVEFF